METLVTIKKLDDGTRLQFETYVQTSLWERYKVNWYQTVRYCKPKKRTWLQAKEGEHYTQDDLKAEKLTYLEELKKEI